MENKAKIRYQGRYFLKYLPLEIIILIMLANLIAVQTDIRLNYKGTGSKITGSAGGYIQCSLDTLDTSWVFKMNIIPADSGKWAIGSENLRWHIIYAESIIGKVDSSKIADTIRGTIDTSQIAYGAKFIKNNQEREYGIFDYRWRGKYHNGQITVGGSAATNALNGNTLYFTPFLTGSAVDTFDTIMIRTGSTAGTKCVFGIYRSIYTGGQYQPAGKIYTSGIFTPTATNTNYYQLIDPQFITSQNTLYFLAANCSTNVSLTDAPSGTFPCIIGSNTSGLCAGNIYYTYTYNGTLPDSVTNTTWSQNSWGGYLWLKKK